MSLDLNVSTLEAYAETIVLLDGLVKQKAFCRVLNSIIRRPDIQSGNMKFLQARCWAGLSKFQKALDLLNSMPSLAEKSDEYLWFKYVLCRRLGDTKGASYLRQKFNPSSTMWLNAPLSEQLEHCISGSSAQMSIPFLRRPGGKLIANSIEFMDMLLPDYTDTSILRNDLEDCRSEDFKRTKFRAMKLARQDGAFDHDNDMKVALAPVCWGMMILTGPFLHPDMAYDVELAALLACGHGGGVLHPQFDRIFNVGDHCARYTRQDVLITPWKHRIHRVVANIATKELALDLLKCFLQAPLVHKEVIFCGHGDLDGNWVFRDGVVSFNDFVSTVREWEPAHIVSNCCNSKKWGQRWDSEIMSAFKDPGNCGVSLTATSGDLPTMGGVLAETVKHVRDPIVLANLQTILSLAGDSDGRGAQTMTEPEALAELKSAWSTIQDRRNGSVFKGFPQGFSNYEAFMLFCTAFFDALNAIEVYDVVLCVQGSSINGFRWMQKLGKSRLFDESSDYDVGIVSKSLFEKGTLAGIPIRKGLSAPCLHPVCLRENRTAGPEDVPNLRWNEVEAMLAAVQRQANGHTVNFVTYPELNFAACHTGASLVVQRESDGDPYVGLYGTLWAPTKRFLDYTAILNDESPESVTVASDIEV